MFSESLATSLPLNRQQKVPEMLFVMLLKSLLTPLNVSRKQVPRYPTASLPE